MFSNYLSIILKELKKQPGFSAIKILSLAIGLACGILVILHVQYSFRFDKHFPNWENTYRLVTDFNDGGQELSAMVSANAYEPLLRQDYPRSRYIANVTAGYGLFSRGGVASGNSLAWVDPDFVRIFSLDFIRGDAATALAEPGGLVLTETAAAKYFPGEDPLGQVLSFDGQADLQVRGVIRDLPDNTHFDLQILASVETGRQLYSEGFLASSNWYRFDGTVTYLSFDTSADAAAVAADLGNFVDRHLPEGQGQAFGLSGLRLSLEPLANAYLSPREAFQGFNPRAGVFGYSDSPRAQVLAGLGVFALLILASSAINFTSLSLSQIQERGREIGIRKAIGARRSQIVAQFLLESLLLTTLALLVALPVILLSIPVYTSLTNTGFTAASALQPGPAVILCLFVIATGLLAGLLPALALSRFRPARAVKGKGRGNPVGRFTRSLITVVQFTFSTALIMIAVAVVLQIGHLNTMEIGFNKNELVVFDSTYNWYEPENFNHAALINELGRHPGVLTVGESNTPLQSSLGGDWRLPGEPPGQLRTIGNLIVDEGYLDVLQLELLAGRGFSADFPADFIPQARDSVFPTPEEAGVYGIVITRSAAARFGFDSPAEAIDATVLSGAGFQHRVIGVVEDFHPSGGLEDPAQSPGILRASLDPLTYVFVRIDPGRRQAALAHIDATWARHRPDVPIDRTFFAQAYRDSVAERTEGISRAATFSSVITVLISAFGIYALAFYSGQRRTKEVGIRKVLGATSLSLILLLTWDLLKPVLIACLLAWDASAWLIDGYFEQFSSRVEISPLLYLAMSFATLLLVVLTTASQSYRTANADPVSSLRYE